MRLKSIALAVLLAALALPAAANAAGPVPPEQTYTVNGITADVYGQPVAGRAFFFHGLNGTRPVATFEFGTSDFFNGMRAQGWQVIVTDEPFDQTASQSDSVRQALLADDTAGGSYAAKWSQITRDLVTAADQHFGPARKTLMTGVSWGGLHALLAACADPRVTGYAVHVPVVDPSQLFEFAEVATENMTPLGSVGCEDRLAQRPGFISFGDQDTRVGVAPTQRLVTDLQARSAPLTVREWPTLAHEDTPEATAAFLAWVGGPPAAEPSPAAPAAAPAPAPVASTPAPTVAPASTTAPATTPKPAVNRSTCTRSAHCRVVVKRHRVWHLYRIRGKRDRWVYVRPARQR